MAVMNGRGRNWARIVATVLGAFSVCGGVASFANSMTTTGVTVLFSLLQLALAAVVLVLLWLPSSSAYYRAQGARR
jgi:threonine/homoserine efflux transporter RhtA